MNALMTQYKKHFFNREKLSFFHEASARFYVILQTSMQFASNKEKEATPKQFYEWKSAGVVRNATPWILAKLDMAA